MRTKVFFPEKPTGGSRHHCGGIALESIIIPHLKSRRGFAAAPMISTGIVFLIYESGH